MNQPERPLVHRKFKCPYCNRDIKLSSPSATIKHIDNDHGILLRTKQHIRQYQKDYPQFLWTPFEGRAQLCCPSCMFITHEGDHQGLNDHFWDSGHVIRQGPVLPAVVPPLILATAPAAVLAGPVNHPEVGFIQPANHQDALQATANGNMAQDVPPPPPIEPQRPVQVIRQPQEDTRQFWSWDHISSQQVRDRLEAIAAYNNPAFIRRSPYWEIELEEKRLNNKPHLFHDYQEEFPDIYRDGPDVD